MTYLKHHWDPRCTWLPKYWMETYTTARQIFGRLESSYTKCFLAGVLTEIATSSSSSTFTLRTSYEFRCPVTISSFLPPQRICCGECWRRTSSKEYPGMTSSTSTKLTSTAPSRRRKKIFNMTWWSWWKKTHLCRNNPNKNLPCWWSSIGQRSLTEIVQSALNSWTTRTSWKRAASTKF